MVLSPGQGARPAPGHLGPWALQPRCPARLGGSASFLPASGSARVSGEPEQRPARSPLPAPPHPLPTARSFTGSGGRRPVWEMRRDPTRDKLKVEGVPCCQGGQHSIAGAQRAERSLPAAAASRVWGCRAGPGAQTGSAGHRWAGTESWLPFSPDQCSVQTQRKLFMAEEKESNYALISAPSPGSSLALTATGEGGLPAGQGMLLRTDRMKGPL